jgi:5-carboxymethyl-2-hydroxymuconate isomerase
MPHVIIECSSNVGGRANLHAIVEAMHTAALETGVFPIGGLRVRVNESEIFRIADGDPANAFVHVELRIGAGRDLATRERAAKHMFDALTAVLADAFERTPIGISLELNEIVPETSHKLNNLHEYVEKRRNAS